MSILIKGMEMPCACVSCELYDGDLYWCRGAKKDVAYSPDDKRAEFCPLVPIPPHGRLIDADALMRHKGDCYDADGHLLYAVGTGNILCAPTIIEAEGEYHRSE